MEEVRLPLVSVPRLLLAPLPATLQPPGSLLLLRSHTSCSDVGAQLGLKKYTRAQTPWSRLARSTGTPATVGHLRSTDRMREGHTRRES